MGQHVGTYIGQAQWYMLPRVKQVLTQLDCTVATSNSVTNSMSFAHFLVVSYSSVVTPVSFTPVVNGACVIPDSIMQLHSNT